MKKLLWLLAVCFCTTSSFSQEAIRHSLAVAKNGKQILTLNGKPFTGLRIEALAYEKRILAQPDDQQLLLINEDKTAGELGGTDDRLLFMQNKQSGFWELILTTALANGKVIENAFVVPDTEITVFLGDKKADKPWKTKSIPLQ